MKRHLAIMSWSVINAILNGKKTIETRFSKHKIAPFGQISVGDLVYMKAPGDEIIGQFRVKKVIFYGGLEKIDVGKIFEDFGQRIFSGQKEEDEKYQKEKLESFYGTLIFIGQSERLIVSPLKIKKRDQRGWVVLD